MIFRSGIFMLNPFQLKSTKATRRAFSSRKEEKKRTTTTIITTTFSEPKSQLPSLSCFLPLSLLFLVLIPSSHTCQPPACSVEGSEEISHSFTSPCIFTPCLHRLLLKSLLIHHQKRAEPRENPALGRSVGFGLCLLHPRICFFFFFCCGFVLS